MGQEVYRARARPRRLRRNVRLQRCADTDTAAAAAEAHQCVEEIVCPLFQDWDTFPVDVPT